VVTQLGQCHAQLDAQVVEAPGVVKHHLAGIGQTRLLARAIDERLAHLGFQALHGHGNRGLGPQQASCRAREALFTRDSTKDFEGVQVHGEGSCPG
jgi:hypothetical protein